MGGTEIVVNYSNVIVWLFVAQWIFNIGAALWLFLRDKDDKNETAVKAVATEQQKQNERLGRIEAVMEHMPTTEEVTQLRTDVASIKARVEGMSEPLRQLNHQVGLIHEHLLRHH